MMQYLKLNELIRRTLLREGKKRRRHFIFFPINNIQIWQHQNNVEWDPGLQGSWETAVRGG